MQLRFVKPVFYADELKVNTGLVDYENRLKVVYQIVNCRGGEVLTKGYTVQVAFNMKTKEMEFVSPEVFCEKVRALL
jgi:acyl-CoA thioester hydrolase